MEGGDVALVGEKHLVDDVDDTVVAGNATAGAVDDEGRVGVSAPHVGLDGLTHGHLHGDLLLLGVHGGEGDTVAVGVAVTRNNVVEEDFLQLGGVGHEGIKGTCGELVESGVSGGKDGERSTSTTGKGVGKAGRGHGSDKLAEGTGTGGGLDNVSHGEASLGEAGASGGKGGGHSGESNNDEDNSVHFNCKQRKLSK